MLKAKALQPGDTIAIVSPSWGGVGAFPHRAEAGIKHLNALGYQVKMAEHAANEDGYLSDTAENRAQDIHDMFLDPEVKMILTAIGGDHSCHLLPHLNFDLIRQNPKIFVGFSDNTVLNNAIHQQTGLTTFSGLSLLTDFAEYPHMFEYTQDYFLKAVTKAEPIGKIEPSPFWTEEMLSWETKADQTRPRHRQETAGWTWLKSGFGEGPLIGGCLESLQHLRGTPYWPDWNGAIMFFETSEEKPSPKKVDGILMDYENMGVLEKLSGMLVGRSMFYSEPEKQQLREIILARTEKFRFPIITEMDFGHTAPQFILPLGCRARIDGHQGTFEIIEAAVQNPTILVSLSDLIDELDTANEEFPTFLNLQTGKIVAVTSEALAVPQGTRSPDTVLEWEQEMVDLALEIVDKNTYLKLPSPSQINEADIIKNFSQNYPDPQLSSALLATSQSGSPLQRFKTTLQQHNIEQEWYAYKTNALEQIALEWLKANKLSYS